MNKFQNLMGKIKSKMTLGSDSSTATVWATQPYLLKHSSSGSTSTGSMMTPDMQYSWTETGKPIDPLEAGKVFVYGDPYLKEIYEAPMDAVKQVPSGVKFSLDLLCSIYEASKKHNYPGYNYVLNPTKVAELHNSLMKEAMNRPIASLFCIDRPIAFLKSLEFYSKREVIVEEDLKYDNEEFKEVNIEQRILNNIYNKLFSNPLSREALVLNNFRKEDRKELIKQLTELDRIMELIFSNNVGDHNIGLSLLLKKEDE